jgi:hypothetical protein
MDIISKSILVLFKTSCVVAAAVIYMKYKCIKCGGGEGRGGSSSRLLSPLQQRSFTLSHSNSHARMSSEIFKPYWLTPLIHNKAVRLTQGRSVIKIGIFSIWVFLMGGLVIFFCCSQWIPNMLLKFPMCSPTCSQ